MLDSVSSEKTTTYDGSFATPSIFPSTQPKNDHEAPPARHEADLEAVVGAWPTLPHAVRAGIMAMVQATAAQIER